MVAVRGCQGSADLKDTETSVINFSSVAAGPVPGTKHRLFDDKFDPFALSCVRSRNGFDGNIGKRIPRAAGRARQSGFGSRNYTNA